MTTLDLYGGPIKRTVIEDAYAQLGLSCAEWDIEAEEFALGVRALDQLMAAVGCTTYNYGGTAEAETGLAATDILAVVAMLAQQIMSPTGKVFTPNGEQAKAISSFRAKWQVIPERMLGRQTIRGAGNRWYGGFSPFFVTPTPSDEIPQ